MSSHASSSRHHLRSNARREPLVSLALTSFLPDVSSLPSPISLPSKRGPSTFDSPSSPGGKARKVSRTEKDGSETIRKTRSAKELRSQYRTQTPAGGIVDDSAVVTPRVKHVLERDDLGTGKSPARRLFVGMAGKEEQRVSGISGAIATPTHSPSGRKLAPSPPILDSPSSSRSSLPSSSTSAIDVDVQAQPEYSSDQEDGDVHDCGFIIYQDDDGVNRTITSQATEYGLRTPRSSRRTAKPDSIKRSTNIIISAPGTPDSSSSILDVEDQENIPPPPYTSLPPYSPSKSRSHSAQSTPSKFSTTSTSTDDEIVSLYLSAPWTHTPSSTSGSGTRRRERSKLMNEVRLLRGETMSEKMDIDLEGGDDGDGEELTPGKKGGGAAIIEGRKRLAMEVDMA
ncbi:hypothetical protein I317_06297 [Kwoniella heveanensis CBS 569]|nr:hypothetical protein I317_06297 [Kwoniella heveanensis CBS 569]